MTSAADLEFSAFLRVMEVISSVEAEVSSSEAACSDAPCASAWLEEATCEEALLICPDPSDSSKATRRSPLLRLRTTLTTAAPIPRNATMIRMAIQRLLATLARAVSIDSASNQIGRAHV